MSDHSEKELEILEAELLGEPELLMEPNSNSNCRICVLSKEDKHLYNWICDKALLGTPYNRIEKLLEEHIESNNLRMTPIGKKSIWTHFENHYSPREQARLISGRNSYVPHKDAELVSVSALIDSDNFDEYKELCSLYIKFREVHDKIYQKAGALQHNEQWAQSKIQSYNSMINTQKSILAEIAKMRQSNKLISVASKFIIENYVRSIISKLSSEFSTILHLMRRQEVDEAIIEAFEELTGQRLASILTEEALDAMSVTKREFKLPN